MKVREISSIYKVREKNTGYDTFCTTPEAVYNFCIDELNMDCLPYEMVTVLFLNTKNRIIGYSTVSKGNINSSVVDNREIFRNAILKNAKSIILVHNHPSGDTTASNQDIEVTKKVYKAGELLEITLLDHIIIGESYNSLQKYCY